MYTFIQLGMDCVSNISHVSNVACFTLLCQAESTIWLFLLQGSLQFSFFMAQWEEYYTGVLPHAVGNYCGVTEVTVPLFDTRLSRIE